MNLVDFIRESIFEDKYTYLFDLFWDNFDEDGFVITDEEGHEIDCIFKAVAIQNILGEFVYRLYDEVNETDFESVVRALSDLGFDESQIIQYCEDEEEIDVDEEDNAATIKNALDYTTQIVADKLLEMFSADDLIICSPQHMPLSRISPFHLRIRMNFLPSLIQTRKSWMNTRKNTRRLWTG